MMMYWLIYTPWLYVLLPRDCPHTIGDAIKFLLATFLSSTTGTLSGSSFGQSAADDSPVESVDDQHVWHAFTGAQHTLAEGDVPLLMLGVYTSCASVTMGLSALYHTFMPTARTRGQYNTLLKCDVAGVWLINVAGWTLSLFTVGACAAPLWARLTPLLLVGGGTLLMIIRADTALQRGVPLLLIALPRMVGFPLRLWLGLGTGQGTGLWAISEMVAVVGGAVNIARVPERWAPGQHDYFNSHTIMHVLALVAIATAHLASAHDRAWIMQADHHVRACLAAETQAWLPPAQAAAAQAVQSLLGSAAA
jgi:hypothetical protein